MEDYSQGIKIPQRRERRKGCTVNVPFTSAKNSDAHTAAFSDAGPHANVVSVCNPVNAPPHSPSLALSPSVNHFVCVCNAKPGNSLTAKSFVSVKHNGATSGSPVKNDLKRPHMT